MSRERTGPPGGKFDKEFKLMAVELSKSRDNINELAKELTFVQNLSTAGAQSI